MSEPPTTDVRISGFRTAILAALEREAEHWIRRVSAHDLYWEPLPCGGRSLVTSSGLVLSTVRTEVTGYVISVLVERADGGEP